MGPFPVQDPPRQETSNFLSWFFGFVTCHTSRNKMGFGDVKTAAGVKALNDFLADKAYIEGFVPSQVDVAVFEAMGGKAPAADMAHALRWYNQIKSYSAEESKKIPVGYGINKLQVMCTVEDEKVSIEELSEKIEEFEDFVQSVDIAAMNKI